MTGLGDLRFIGFKVWLCGGTGFRGLRFRGSALRVGDMLGCKSYRGMKQVARNSFTHMGGWWFGGYIQGLG